MKTTIPFVWLLLLVVLSSCDFDLGPKPIPSSVDQTNTPTTIDTPAVPRQQEGFFSDYRNENRSSWNKPEIIIDLLGDLTDKTVVDIGAGTGFFALRLAQRAQRVIAVDIDEYYTNLLDSIKQEQLSAEIATRLETRLGAADSPNLLPAEADIALIVNTYMYIPNRVDYLKTLQAGLRDGGKVVIVDFKKKNMPVGPSSEVKLTLNQVETELAEAGFEQIETNDMLLNYQYIVLGVKPQKDPI